MIVAAVAIVAFVAFAGLLAYVLKQQSAERELWSIERHSLLNRVQHPQVLQPTNRDTPAPPASDPEPDVLAMVGGVFNDPADTGG